MAEHKTYRHMCRQNREKAKQLQSQYFAVYKNVAGKLKSKVRPGPELETALGDLLDLLLAAQVENRSVTEVLPDQSQFIQELIEHLPVFTPEVKKQRQVRRLTVVAGTFILLFYLVLHFSGLISYWQDGMYYILDRPDRYYVRHELLENEEFSVQINLGDESAYKDKLVAEYNGGEIYIHSIDSDGCTGYRIWFYAEADYDLRGMNMLSGIKRKMTPERLYTSDVKAKLITEYAGHEFLGAVAGSGSIAGKDREMFGFIVFPSIVVDSGADEESPDHIPSFIKFRPEPNNPLSDEEYAALVKGEDVELTITLSNLYMHYYQLR